MNRTSTLDERIVYGIVTVAFLLSYSTLAGLAERSGYSVATAYAWPIAVEALAVVAARAAMRLRTDDGRRYATRLLAATTTISVASAAASRLLPPGPLPGWAAAVVTIIPTLCVLVAPHLAVQLRRDAESAVHTDAPVAATHDDAGSDAPDDEPTRHTAPDTEAPAVTLTAVPDLPEHRDAPADQHRRTMAHSSDALFDIDAQEPDAVAASATSAVDAARESNDAKWPRALHLLTTTRMSQRAVAEEVGMSDAALRRRIGPGGRDALLAGSCVG